MPLRFTRLIDAVFFISPFFISMMPCFRCCCYAYAPRYAAIARAMLSSSIMAMLPLIDSMLRHAIAAIFAIDADAAAFLLI